MLFHSISSQVVCRQLGFSHAASFGTATYGQGSGDIVLDDVNCAGREKSVTQCSHVTAHNCGHAEDVSVNCRPLRLVGSPSYREGKRGDLKTATG